MSPSIPNTTSPLAIWLDYLGELHPKNIELGLDRIKQVADKLQIKLDCVKFTVGGTNGKGSTCAMLEAIMLQAGYRVGMYTSPHLLRFNERIKINGIEATDEQIIAKLDQIEQTRGDVSLTYFEYTTLAALLIFQEQNLDAVILEVGLGGRLDAVNIIDTDCAIVTSIDLDHTEYLGNTREEIAFEKAHIFRPGKPAICADPLPPQTLLDYAQKIGADLWQFGIDYNYSGDRQQWAYGSRYKRRNALAYPSLRGANQLINASAAIAALENVRDRIVVTQQEIRQGLLHINLPARMQILPGLPATILDVAHNPHAAAALGQNLDSMGHYPHTYAIVGMLHDKDIANTLAKFTRRVDRWMCATTNGPRGMSAQELADELHKFIGTDEAPVDPFIAQTSEIVRRPKTAEHKPGVRAAPRPAIAKRDIQINCYESPVAAFNTARELATDNDRILVFGSFTTVGPVLELLRQEGRDV